MEKIPYFETKVVRMGKVRKHKHKYIEGWAYGKYYVRCIVCGKLIWSEPQVKPIKNKQPKGTWVNGENLDKIKFPCFCRFDANKGLHGDPPHNYKVHGIGIINKNYYEGKIHYELSWADRQSESEGEKYITNLSVLCGTTSLEHLIKLYDIHILKGKVVIFEEEK